MMSASHPCQAPATPRARGVRLLTTLGIVAWLGLGGGALCAREPEAAPVGAVDDGDLQKAAADTSNWLMYGRTYDAQRYSPLKQINAENVGRLIPAWTFQTGVL